MVRVAVCPKCSHESVMFDKADSEQWARCPECRTHFQIKQAEAREIPQLVITKDEALLAEEESEAAKETVNSATLDTRWDTRRTLNAASTQTIAGVEPATASSPPKELNGSEESLPPESGKDAAKRTVSDLSTLATWSELPIDQNEAQARAEQAGDTPVNFPVTSETPTLRLRRSRDGDETARENKSPESGEDSGDRFEKWFQTKATIFDFAPPTLDETDNVTADDAQPVDEPTASPDFETDDQSEIDIESASDDESSHAEESSPDGTEAESTNANQEPDAVRATGSPAWPQARPVPNWARSNRRRSPLRMFVMIGFGGIVGTALGYYALLWLFGPQRDFLNAGQYLPSAILPREFRSPVITLPTNDATITDTTSAADLVAGDEEPIEIEIAAPEEGSESAAHGLAREPAEIVGAPSFSADELAVALGKAKEAQAGLLAGNFDDGAEVKRTKGHSYMAFCDLAQKATFVDKNSNSYASALESEVPELVRTTLADAHAQQEVARLVPLWVKSTKRTHAGIFFAGRVTKQADKGSVVECQLDFGGGELLTVLVAPEQAASIAPSALPLAVLGWIVDQPAINVDGYTGDAAQAVWAGHVVSLE